jgi:TRAP-type C4-dicarboxylate transport system permease small subunit
MKAFDRWIGRTEALLGGVASAMLLATMLIVVADVVLRYFFRSPLAWSYDLVSLYLMVGLFFFSMSDTLNHGEHVCVDILHKYMPAGLRRFNEAVGCALGSTLFGAIFWMGCLRTLSAFQAGEVGSGSIPWPMWLSAAAVPIGAGTMVLRMTYRFVGHVVAFAGGPAVVPLPAAAGSQEAA